MANGYGAMTLADMLRQGVPQDALQARQVGLADALRTAPARRPPKPAQPYPREWFDLPADQLPDEAVADDFFTDSYLTYNAPTQAQQRAARVNTPYPRELFEMSPENIPEEYLTDPTFAASYHAYKGTRPTPSQPDALLQASPEQIPEEYLSNPAFAQAYHAASKTQPTQPREPAAQRPWFADMPLEQIPEEMLSDPDFAAAYNAWHGTEATEPTELDDDEDDAEPLMVQGGAETRAPGVYPVEGEPGMIDVVLGGGAGGRMSEEEFYSSPDLTAAVREAMAPQRAAEGEAAQPAEPAVALEVGQPEITARVPQEARAEAPAAPMTPEQQQAALGAVRSGRETTRAVAEGPVLRREEPAAMANGKGNGPPSQVVDIVKTAAPAVQQAIADNLITPEGLRLLTVLTRDPTLMRIGEIVAGEAASERQLKSKEALAKQTAADKAKAAADRQAYLNRMAGAAEESARARMKAAGRARVGAMPRPVTEFQNKQLARQAEMDDQRLLEKLAKESDKALFSDALDALQTMEAVAPGVTFGEVPKEVPATGLGERFLSGVGLRGWMGPQEAEARQALQNLRDVVKRARSGAAITASEERSYLGLLGDQALASPQAMTTALSQFRRTFGQRLAGLQSPYEKVLPRYKGPKAAEFLERPGAKGGEQSARRITRTVGGETRVWNGTAWVKE